MLDLRYVTENIEDVTRRLSTRGAGAAGAVEAITVLAKGRRLAIAEVEALKAERNVASKAMAAADKKGPEFAERRGTLKALSTKIKALDVQLKSDQESLNELVQQLPNLPHDSTPVGTSEADNPVLRTFGEQPTIANAKEHVELGVGLDILDFERGAKISGARFTVLKGAGARLERALMQFMLDLHVDEHGYTELWPPALVRDSALRGTGQLPKFEADLFKVERKYEEGDESERIDLYLSPTAEVQVTNYHAGEIFEPGALPQTYCAYTPCFRSEAGSYGKDTKGLIRQHQFDKVELVHFCAPEDGEARLEELLKHAETVLQRLNLHYQVVQLCTADMGFSAQKAFDIEVWLPGQQAFREISSCSWFGDFQARRAKIRYRPEVGGKPSLVHTLNGSGLAVGRTLVAVLEQYQQEDGSILIPEALRPYMGGREVIR